MPASNLAIGSTFNMTTNYPEKCLKYLNNTGVSMSTSKLPAFFFILLLFIYPLQSQDINVGFVGGYHLSGMKIDLEDVVGEEDVSSVSKMGAGLIVDIPIREIFSIRINPVYLNSGFTYHLDAGDMEVDFDLWSLAIHLKKEFGNKVRPYVLTGPVFEYITNAQGESVINELGGLKLTTDLSTISNEWNTGIDLGGGISLPIKWGSILIEGIYTFGISNMNKGGTIKFKNQGVVFDEGIVDKKDIFKRNGFRLLIGFSLPLHSLKF